MITEDAYTVEPWCVREVDSPRLDVLADTESVFALANGCLGIRGTLDEGDPVGQHGTYLSGVHELRTMVYTETAAGDPEATQTLVDTIDGTPIRLLVDGQPLDVREGDLLHHDRVLDLRADEELGVHPQAAGFTDQPRWDFAGTAEDQYPLHSAFPYLQLYRKQVVKQADLVLAMHLRGDAFTPEEKVRNFEYYEGVTVRDSSLSACCQAVLAAETGHLDLAHDYVAEGALADLRDTEHDSGDGLHVAALAGTWIAVVAGFGGLRQTDAALRFRPALPDALPRLAFRFRFRGRVLRVTVEHGRATYELLAGSPLRIHHEDTEVELTGDGAVSRPTVPRAGRPAVTHPETRGPGRRTRPPRG